MKRSALGLVLSALTVMVITQSSSVADESASTALRMAPELKQLFQLEMKELMQGTQKVASYIPVANWDGIVSSAVAMRDSYVLEKKLTPAQKHELEKLPDQFKALDESFHLRAAKLADAAKTKDAELVSFQFGRLLDSCVACHSAYAAARFPNFRREVGGDHHH